MSRKVLLPAPPTPRELERRAKKARERLETLFQRRKLRPLSVHAVRGLRRLNEKLAMALLLAEHMKQRKIRSIAELAECLYIDGEGLEALRWMRSPVAFARISSQKRYDAYLLALCGIDWDPRTKSFVCIVSGAS